MKAIVVSEFGDESVLKYQDAPTPEPGSNEVCVRIKAVGVNPVETYIRSGKYAQLPTLPYTPGNDGAGIVEKVGCDVTDLKVGDRVFVAAALARHNTGSYAQYMVCDADAVRALPENLSFAEGAGMGTPGLAAAYALFSKACIRPGETVLIHGATGGVGSLAVQLARRTGTTVLGTAGSAEGEKLVKELGAHQVFNHKEDGYLQKISDATNGKGPDVIIEMIANVNLAKDLSILAQHGRIVIVGNRGSLDFNPRDVMSKDATIMGIVINNMPHKEFVSNMYILSAALESGMKPVIDEQLPLQDAPRAHQQVIEGGGPGKIVLITDED